MDAQNHAHTVHDGEASNSSTADGEGRRTVFAGELLSCSAGEYHFAYTLQEAGNYSLSVLVGKNESIVGGKPLLIEALPGALSGQYCGLVGEMIGTGTLLYGSSVTFGVYLRDAFGNYISCAHYRRGRKHHNISSIVIYYEGGDDSAAGWSSSGRLGRCRDSIYHESSAEKIDGLIDVTFMVPHDNMNGSSTKELSIDLEVLVNGRRLKEGPYPTLMRPARLDPARSVLLGPGVRGSQPGQKQVLVLQLINELDENMTTCSASSMQVVGTATAQVKCGDLKAEACRSRPDCTWLVIDSAVGSGMCNTVQQRELVEIYLEPVVDSEDIVFQGSEASKAQTDFTVSGLGGDANLDLGIAEAAGADHAEKRAGVVQSCDHGKYTLVYSMTDAGRYTLHVKVAGQTVGEGPWRVTVAPGCRSGAVVFPCLGRGICQRGGGCTCTDGYLGSQCQTACPGLSDDGTYCSGRGNCSAVSVQKGSPSSSGRSEARSVVSSLAGATGDEILGMCSCEYGYYGRLCDRECPGGAASPCSDSGSCLDNGDCECWSGYSGDKCQFKSKEVKKFGNIVALSILSVMFLITMLLVAWILIKVNANPPYPYVSCFSVLNHVS